MAESVSPSNPELVACILLAGGLKPSPLTGQAGMSVLDMYLRPGVSVIGQWLDRFEELARVVGHEPKIHVVHGAATPPPTDVEARKRGVVVRVDKDRQQYRGPAGALKDACDSYRSDDTILVAEAGRFVACSLVPMLAAHRSSEAQITVAYNPDSSPAGVFLIQCRTLDLVPPIGFMDLKEQWLGKAVESGHNVRVHRLSEPHSYELRTREDFLAAARVAGGLVCTTFPTTNGVDVPGISSDMAHPLGEGVSVGAGAVIVDSVIMQGAEIGAGAVVARSLVCPFGRVAPGATVVDAVIPPGAPARVGKQEQEIRG